MGQATRGGRWLIVVTILVVGFPSLWTKTTTTTVHAFSTSLNGSRSTSSSSSSSSSSTPESIEHLFIEFVDVTTATTAMIAAEEDAAGSPPSSLSSSTTNNKLPVSWTQNWSTWVLEPMKSTTTTTATATATNTQESSSLGGAGDVFVKIPDTDGFVPPSSVDTLFQPIDLMAPTMSLALGVHMYVNKGTIFCRGKRGKTTNCPPQLWWWP